MKGLVFAIEEMAVHDGPGLRTTIFLKGCPLRCQWCHNPEGWEMRSQRVKNPNGCLHCGACAMPCETACGACGNCLARCPRGLIRISGKWWDARDLAERVRANEALLRAGGVTISGGEPLMQPGFLVELLDVLSPLHRAIETSGYGRAEDWEAALARLELVYFDVKLVDSEKHRRYTGVENGRILHNLKILKERGVPFIVRIPTIAGVNDDAENMTATARLLQGADALIGVEILPYNPYAGAKYALLAKSYEYAFQRPSAEVLDAALRVFEDAGIRATIR